MPDIRAPIARPAPAVRARAPAEKVEPAVPAVFAADVSTLKYTITLVAF